MVKQFLLITLMLQCSLLMAAEFNPAAVGLRAGGSPLRRDPGPHVPGTPEHMRVWKKTLFDWVCSDFPGVAHHIETCAKEVDAADIEEVDPLYIRFSKTVNARDRARKNNTLLHLVLLTCVEKAALNDNRFSVQNARRVIVAIKTKTHNEGIILEKDAQNRDGQTVLDIVEQYPDRLGTLRDLFVDFETRASIEEKKRVQAARRDLQRLQQEAAVVQERERKLAEDVARAEADARRERDARVAEEQRRQAEEQRRRAEAQQRADEEERLRQQANAQQDVGPANYVYIPAYNVPAEESVQGGNGFTLGKAASLVVGSILALFAGKKYYDHIPAEDRVHQKDAAETASTLSF